MLEPRITRIYTNNLFLISRAFRIFEIYSHIVCISEEFIKLRKDSANEGKVKLA